MAGFETFAIVELMGHQTIAGKVTEETLFGVAMMRVDVPKTQMVDGFTKYYSAGSIYCVTPTDEATAQAAAERFEQRPVQSWILPASPALAAKIASGFDPDGDIWDDDEHDERFDDVEDFDDDDPPDDDPNEAIVPDALTTVHMQDDYHTDDKRPGDTSGLSDKERAIRRAKELLERKFIVFDTETTGFDEDDEIIQIAIVDETGATVLKSLIKPTKPITNSQYHGITDEMVKDAPTFPEIYPKLVELMNGNLWLAYNAEYDVRMLLQSCQLHKLDALGASRTECAMLLYVDFYGEWDEYHGNNRWHKLDVAIKRLGIERVGNAHDAESDAKATLEVLKAMAATESEKKPINELPF